MQDPEITLTAAKMMFIQCITQPSKLSVTLVCGCAGLLLVSHSPRDNSLTFFNRKVAAHRMSAK